MENIETKVEEIETEEAIEESVDTDFEGLELTEDELVEKLDLLSLIDIDKLKKVAAITGATTAGVGAGCYAQKKFGIFDKVIDKVNDKKYSMATKIIQKHDHPEEFAKTKKSKKAEPDEVESSEETVEEPKKDNKKSK